MYDLMYCGEHKQEIQALVAAAFPNLTIEDASDYIHPGRFSVDGDINDNDWHLWLMRNGVHTMSFNWELTRMEKPQELKPLIEQVIAEQDASE